MLKKTVTYKDYDGIERTEDFYFNLNKAELAEMNLTTEGGLEARMSKITKAKNTPELIRLFKDILKLAYGVKTDDGRRLIKNDQVWEEFVGTEAYSIIFMELFSDDESALAFIRNVLPQDLAKEAIKALEVEGQMALPPSSNA